MFNMFDKLYWNQGFMSVDNGKEADLSQSSAEREYDATSQEEWIKISNQLNLNIEDEFEINDGMIAWMNKPFDYEYLDNYEEKESKEKPVAKSGEGQKRKYFENTCKSKYNHKGI